MIPGHRGEQNLGARLMAKADIDEIFCVFGDGAAFKQLLIPERDGDIAEEQERQTLAALANGLQDAERFLIAIIRTACGQIRRIEDEQDVAQSVIVQRGEVRELERHTEEIKRSIETGERHRGAHDIRQPGLARIEAQRDKRFGQAFEKVRNEILVAYESKRKSGTRRRPERTKKSNLVKKRKRQKRPRRKERKKHARRRNARKPKRARQRKRRAKPQKRPNRKPQRNARGLHPGFTGRSGNSARKPVNRRTILRRASSP